eukprot:4201585-Amphidinium_carterae.1
MRNTDTTTSITRIEYAMGDFMNFCLHTHSVDYAQHRNQLRQPFHLTTRLTEYLKQAQNR